MYCFQTAEKSNDITENMGNVNFQNCYCLMIVFCKNPRTVYKMWTLA